MYLIDTNIHAAYLLQNFEKDDLTEQYRAFYKTIPLVERVLPDFILGEFETFIMQVIPSRYQLRGDDKKELKEIALDYIYELSTKCTFVVADMQVVQRARDIYFENVKAHYISFVDSLLLATAEKNAYTILTKDKRVMLLAEHYGIPFFQV